MSGSVEACGSLFLRRNRNGGRKSLPHQDLLSSLSMMVNGVGCHGFVREPVPQAPPEHGFADEPVAPDACIGTSSASFDNDPANPPTPRVRRATPR